jgi:putative acetyltransferase
MQVSKESPDQPEVIALIADLDAYQDALYPAEVRYALDLASLMQSNVIFLVARDGEGTAVGCGAVVITAGVGELKRMCAHRTVDTALRVACWLRLRRYRSGLGARSCSWKQGPTSQKRWLSTARKGTQGAGRLGAYPDHPLSVFMGKHLVLREPEA